MTELKIFRNDGGEPISVTHDAVELNIEEPVSALTNIQEVLSALPKLERLVCYVMDYGKTESTRSLGFLRGAKRLKELTLSSMEFLEDCDALIDCTSLESVSVNWRVSKRFDYDVLPLIASLRSFSVTMPTNAILSRVSKAVQLTYLHAGGGFKLPSLEPLASLKNLEHLTLWSGSLASSRGLSGFPKLKTLNVGHSKLQDTTELGAVSGLKKLELAGNKGVTNLEFLQEGDLELLNVYEIPSLESFKPISRLPRLKEVRSYGKIVDEDMEPLVNHPSLEKVAVSGRYKAKLKKFRVDSRCVFRVGKETMKLTKNGPLVLQTAGEWQEILLKKIKTI